VNRIKEETGKENLMLRRKEAKGRENKSCLLFMKFPLAQKKHH
jgi:hypothetical protein